MAMKVIFVEIKLTSAASGEGRSKFDFAAVGSPREYDRDREAASISGHIGSADDGPAVATAALVDVKRDRGHSLTDLEAWSGVDADGGEEDGSNDGLSLHLEGVWEGSLKRWK
jgi:hypothetical protein